WVIRTDVPHDMADQLEQVLVEATRKGLNSVGEISRARAGRVMSESDVADYVRNFTYFLGPEERAGQQEFKRRLSELPAWRPPATENDKNYSGEPTNREVIPTP
ncbi:hypothetical protein JYT32_00840, partial [Dehalococcoides mccartyi]|nr:hypothetical protein [Dehalococcoides mccartyi]